MAYRLMLLEWLINTSDENVIWLFTQLENAPQPPYVIHSDPGGMHLLEPNKFSDCDLEIVEDNHTKFHR